MKIKKTKEQKHPDVIPEPKPGSTHLICALCREQFKDYMQHITSESHRNKGVARNSDIFTQIDEVLDDLYKNLDAKVKVLMTLSEEVRLQQISSVSIAKPVMA